MRCGAWRSWRRPPCRPIPSSSARSWRATWLERLRNTPEWVAQWLEHQRRDAYWKYGSVSEDYAAIRCPVYAIGGWADAYRNAVPRLLTHLTVPSKGLIGPWAHGWPLLGVPEPAIGFLQETLRWWDKWLKGIETGIMDEPRYRVWMQDAIPRAAGRDSAAGALDRGSALAVGEHRPAPPASQSRTAGDRRPRRKRR